MFDHVWSCGMCLRSAVDLSICRTDLGNLEDSNSPSCIFVYHAHHDPIYMGVP